MASQPELFISQGSEVLQFLRGRRGVGGLDCLDPEIPLVTITVLVEVGNALLLPIVLTFLLLLTNDKKLLGKDVNGWKANLMVGAVGVIIILLGLVSVSLTLFPTGTHGGKTASSGWLVEVSPLCLNLCEMQT